MYVQLYYFHTKKQYDKNWSFLPSIKGDESASFKWNFDQRCCPVMGISRTMVYHYLNK